MNTIQISRLMNQDEFIRKRFKGVYPIDLIPKDLVYPSIIVVFYSLSDKNLCKSVGSIILRISVAIL